MKAFYDRNTSFPLCAPPFLLGGGLSLLANFQKDGGGGGGDGGCCFNIKSKLKSEIFNNKKVYKEKKRFFLS